MSLESRFNEKYIPEPNSGCWLWTDHVDQQGYGSIHTKSRNSGYSRPVRAHRVAYELYIGPIPEGMLVCHRCDTPSCVNPDHLFTGSNSDNIADKMRKGRQARGDNTGSRKYPERRPRGSKHGCARLTEDDVRYIRSSLMPTAELAAIFGVAKNTISAVKTRQNWKHI